MTNEPKRVVVEHEAPAVVYAIALALIVLAACGVVALFYLPDVLYLAESAIDALDGVEAALRAN